MQLQLPSTIRLRGIALAAFSTLVVALFCAGAARAETTGFTTGDTTSCPGCLVYMRLGADYGQSFTATSDGDLTKVTTHLSRLLYNYYGGDYPWQPVTVEVHTYSGGQVGSAVLASTTIAPDAVYLPAVNGPYDTSKTADAVFSSPAHLTNGQHYALVFSTQTPDFLRDTEAEAYYALAYYPAVYSGYCSLGYTETCGGQIYAGGDMLYIYADGITYTFTDLGGYDLLLTGFYGADVTAPAITANSPQDGATYKQGQSVQADYSCDDGTGSGVALCAGDVASGQNIDTQTLGQHTFTINAADNQGNGATKTVTYTVADQTKPTVSLTSPADGGSYGNADGTKAGFSCADEQGGSGLASCVGTTGDGQSLSKDVGQHQFSVTATDNAGNTTTQTVTYTVVDNTKPTVSLTTPTDGATYGRGDQVAASYSCADEQGGSGLATCAGNVASGQNVDTSTLGQHTFTVQAADNAGNTSSKQVSYTVVDRTPPQVTLNTPADGAAFKLNQSVLADFGCTDEQGGSGLASCLGTAASGSRIDTGTVGSKTFTVNAADNAGNKTTKTNGYSVIYDWAGFFSPINNPTVVNTLKAGQAVPVKFTLAGNQGLGVLADGYPKSQAITCATNPATDAVEETSTASQSGLHYDGGQYNYVWKTSSTWTGCRQLVVKLADGTVHRANFQMK